MRIAKDVDTNNLNVFGDDCRKIGTITPDDIASAVSWSGAVAADIFCEVLTECNFHSEVKQIRKIFREMF